MPPDQQVEFLVRTAQFDIRFEGHRIVALDQRIEKFVDGDGLTGLVSVVEIFPLQHPGHGMFGGELNEIGRAHRIHPCRVEANLGFFWVKNLIDLLLVGLAVFNDFFPRQGLSRHVFAGGVADHPGEVPNQKDCLMA